MLTSRTDRIRRLGRAPLVVVALVAAALALAGCPTAPQHAVAGDAGLTSGDAGAGAGADVGATWGRTDTQADVVPTIRPTPTGRPGSPSCAAGALCSNDAACDVGEACLCDGGCLPAGCRSDADCGPGGFCSAYRDVCGEAVVGWACHRPADSCLGDEECPEPWDACRWHPGEGWGCRPQLTCD